MKNKKMFLPAIILAAVILVTAVSSVISSIAQKPDITEGEFPFKITYELDGETVTIDEVYRVSYLGNSGEYRMYVGEIGDMGEDNTVYTLKKDENTRVELSTRFYADYMIGDPHYDYFERESFEPVIFYYDAEETEYSDEKTLSEQGVKLISYEYPEPLENSFSFSHISYFTSEVIIPTMIVTCLGLLAIIIFVKKEKELKYKAVDIVSVVFNFVIGIVLVPFIIFTGMLMDAEVGGPEIYYQLFYLFPSLLMFLVSASVALRRKGYGVKSLITELAGVVAFRVFLIVCGGNGLY